LKAKLEISTSHFSFKRLDQALSIWGSTGFNLHRLTKHAELLLVLRLVVVAQVEFESTT
jgi:hypothetical protein